MARQIFFIFLLLLISFSACVNKTSKPEWKINEQGYLETQGFNVLVFHDYYPEGDQGGIEFIHHGERTATNGYIRIEMPAGKRFPGPVTADRVIDKDKKEIRATVNSTDPVFNYTLRIWPENNTIHLAVDLEKPIPASFRGKVTFDLQLFPVTYRGKTYHLGEQYGVFPPEGLGPMTSDTTGMVKSEPMAQGQKLLIAPEDPLCKLQIEQVKGNLSLIDDRNSSLSGWIIVRSVIPEGVDKGVLEWVITPNILPDWRRNPSISLSQVGYHPSQVKQAVIELDARTSNIDKAILHRIGNDGKIDEIKSGLPSVWGKFLRYKYAIFDFSDVSYADPRPGSGMAWSMPPR